MNECYEELAKRAGYDEDMFGVGHWDMPECQKLVELIVLECAEIADTHWRNQCPGFYIKEHFGVK